MLELSSAEQLRPAYKSRPFAVGLRVMAEKVSQRLPDSPLPENSRIKWAKEVGMAAKDLENDVADQGWGLTNENGMTDFFLHISEGQRPDSRKPSP